MDSNPLATPQDTIAALRMRYTGELAVADAASQGDAETGWHAEPDSPVVFCEDVEMQCCGNGQWDGDPNSPPQCCGNPDVWKEKRKVAEFGNNADAVFAAAARESVPRDARLKLALLDQVGRDLLPSKDEYRKYSEVSRSNGSGARDAAAICAVHGQALATLRLLAESAGEAVAW